jgi:hypothetical protein
MSTIGSLDPPTGSQTQPPLPAAKPINLDGFQTNQGPNTGSATAPAQGTATPQHALFVTA